MAGGQARQREQGKGAAFSGRKGMGQLRAVRGRGRGRGAGDKQASTWPCVCESETDHEMKRKREEREYARETKLSERDAKQSGENALDGMVLKLDCVDYGLSPAFDDLLSVPCPMLAAELAKLADFNSVHFQFRNMFHLFHLVCRSSLLSMTGNSLPKYLSLCACLRTDMAYTRRCWCQSIVQRRCGGVRLFAAPSGPRLAFAGVSVSVWALVVFLLFGGFFVVLFLPSAQCISASTSMHHCHCRRAR
eukprot:5672095-Pleurochrysis_carterae.AAC.1